MSARARIRPSRDPDWRDAMWPVVCTEDTVRAAMVTGAIHLARVTDGMRRSAAGPTWRKYTGEAKILEVLDWLGQFAGESGDHKVYLAQRATLAEVGPSAVLLVGVWRVRVR